LQRHIDQGGAALEVARLRPHHTKKMQRVRLSRRHLDDPGVELRRLAQRAVLVKADRLLQ
jgi:hypothetical protein